MIKFAWMGALVFVALTAQAFASGELTLLPGYYFNSNRFDVTRIGLYVEEAIVPQWSYVSWTGSGRVFQADSTLDAVTWITTQQDITYKWLDRLTVGGGAGFSWSSPSHYSEVDAHLRISVKLWN